MIIDNKIIIYSINIFFFILKKCIICIIYKYIIIGLLRTAKLNI